MSQLRIRVHPITQEEKRGRPSKLHVGNERHQLHTFSFSQNKLVVQVIYLIEVRVAFFKIFLMTACLARI